jgi:NADP-dependent 3-hydroxy acid dehydrogenase YdfG
VRTALVTGASSGIGRALALELSKRGAHVMVAARRDAELSSLCDAIRARGGRASLAVVDLSDAHAAHDLVVHAEKELGSLDLVIANAAVGGMGHSARLRPEDIENMLNINTVGAIATLAAALPIMLGQKQGHLVGVTSLAARRALPRAALYSASKAALATFLEGVRLDLRAGGVKGIRVSDVQPGFVKTRLTDSNDFKMPFIWQADRAATYITDRIERGNDGIIAFPIPLRIATRVAQLLPFSLHAFATAKFRG